MRTHSPAISSASLVGCWPPTACGCRCSGALPHFNVPRIVSTLRVAGLALVLYAFFGGLIPPPALFFPGDLLNTVSFEQALGVPALVFRSLIGLALAVTIIRALEVFEVETSRMIEAMEQQQILVGERDRIARDLHDGVIQTVYTAGFLVESAQKARAVRIACGCPSGEGRSRIE